MKITNPTGGHLTLDGLIDAIRQEARRRGDNESAPGTAPLKRKMPSRMGQKLFGEIQLKDGAHIREFLPLHGEEFLIIAYRTLLGRSLDSSGAQHYMGALLQGRISRWELLGRLRLSPEGRAKGFHLRGLLLAFLAALIYRLPIIGFIAALLARILALPQWLQFQTRQEMLLSHMERHFS